MSEPRHACRFCELIGTRRYHRNHSPGAKVIVLDPYEPMPKKTGKPGSLVFRSSVGDPR